jgi:O-antigen ligase
MISSLVVLLSLGLAGFTLISQSSSGTLGSVATMGRKDDVSTLSGRIPLWEELVDSISKRPLIGHGYLAYWDSKRVEYLSETFRWEIPHGHNLYLDTMLDIGILGLVVVIFTIFTAMYQALVIYWKTNQIEYGIAFGLFVYAMFNGFAESLFKLPNFPLFVLLACSFSMLFERLPVPVSNAVREALSHPSRIRRGNESQALQSESRSQTRPYPKPIKRPNLL